MFLKGMIAASAIALASASAAYAQQYNPNTAFDPAAGGNSPHTVNPSNDQLLTDRYDTSVTHANQPSNVIMIDGQARVPVSTDVAATTGVPIEVVTNGPVPDTPANRARFGGPDSRAGKMTTPRGN